MIFRIRNPPKGSLPLILTFSEEIPRKREIIIRKFLRQKPSFSPSSGEIPKDKDNILAEMGSIPYN
jgi:hypothetical protein